MHVFHFSLVIVRNDSVVKGSRSNKSAIDPKKHLEPAKYQFRVDVFISSTTPPDKPKQAAKGNSDYSTQVTSTHSKKG